jgi:hypothetical protein
VAPVGVMLSPHAEPAHHAPRGARAYAKQGGKEHQLLPQVGPAPSRGHHAAHPYYSTFFVARQDGVREVPDTERRRHQSTNLLLPGPRVFPEDGDVKGIVAHPTRDDASDFLDVRRVQRPDLQPVQPLVLLDNVAHRLLLSLLLCPPPFLARG